MRDTMARDSCPDGAGALRLFAPRLLRQRWRPQPQCCTPSRAAVKGPFPKPGVLADSQGNLNGTT